MESTTQSDEGKNRNQGPFLTLPDFNTTFRHSSGSNSSTTDRIIGSGGWNVGFSHNTHSYTSSRPPRYFVTPIVVDDDSGENSVANVMKKRFFEKQKMDQQDCDGSILQLRSKIKAQELRLKQCTQEKDRINQQIQECENKVEAARMKLESQKNAIRDLGEERAVEIKKKEEEWEKEKNETLAKMETEYKEKVEKLVLQMKKYDEQLSIMETQWNQEDEKKKGELELNEKKHLEKIEEIRKRKIDVALQDIVAEEDNSSTKRLKLESDDNNDGNNDDDDKDNNNDNDDSAKGKENEQSESVVESQVMSEEMDNIKTDIDGLHQTKSQMIWLLKQVITAEKKQTRDAEKRKSK